MISPIETAGFFLLIAAVLKFSTWAEGFLGSNVRPDDGLAKNATPPLDDDNPEPTREHEALRAS